MFGQNPKLPAEKGSGEFLKITEIFYTLQGEGPNAGRPAVFVRLSGCNLACKFCDTDFDKYQTIGVVEILKKVRQLSNGLADLVVVTGGEPFRQNIAPLCDLMLEAGYKVQIETNGTLYREVHKDVEIVCSPKFQESRYRIHPKFFKHKFYFKFLVSGSDKNSLDINFYKECVSGVNAKVYLQPMDEYNEIKNAMNLKSAVELAMKGGFMLSLQIHKIIGVE